MVKKDSVLLFLFILLVFLSTAALFYRSIILEDFEIMSNDSEVNEE